MKNFKVKRILAILLTAALTLSLFPVSVFAAEPWAKDLEGHWAKPAIETLRTYGIISGDGNGYFMPDRDITRAEFATLVNKAFGYDALAVPELTGYIDVPPGKWYAGQIQTAIALGYIVGYGGGRAGPEDIVTGAQAQIILRKILRQPSFAIPNAGRSPMSRGEAAQLLLNIIGVIVDGDLDAEGRTFTNVTIRKPGVVLSNAVITGDLFITEGVGDGDVWLDTVEIGGRLLAAGGGENSIHVRDITVGANVIVDKPSVAGEQPVRFRAAQANGRTVVFEGAAREIIISEDIIIIIDTDGEKTVFNMFKPGDESEKPAVVISENASVDKITVFVPAEIGGEGGVGKVEAHTGGIVVGEGVKVENIEALESVEVTVGGETVTGTGITDPTPEPEPEPFPSDEPAPEPSPGPTPGPTPSPAPNPAPSPGGNNGGTPALGGTASITGTNKIGETLTVVTTSVTGGSGAFGYQWRANGEDITGAANAIYTIQGADAAKTITCVVTRADATGSVTATGSAVPYTITLVISGNAGTDAVSFSNAVAVTETTALSGSVTIYYTLDNTEVNNALNFSGVTSPPAAVNAAETGTRAYTVNAADASYGVIEIDAVFTHSGKSIQTITFTQGGTLHKTYGDAAFTDTASGGAGTGAITYESNNTAVATVNASSGQVTITGAGNATITATKAECATHAQAQASYHVEVAKANPSVTWPSGLTATAGQTLGDITLPGNGSAVPSGTFSWTAGNSASVGMAGSNQHNMTFTPDDTASYNTRTQDVTVTVAPIALTIGAPSAPTYSNNTNSRNALTPITAASPAYTERTATFTVAVSGFASNTDANNVRLNITGVTGLTFSGHDATGNASGGTKTFTVTVTLADTAAFAAGTAAIDITGLTNMPGNYVCSDTQSTSVSIIDGQAAVNGRQIPVTNTNAAAFNAYANTTAGLTRHYKQTGNITLTAGSTNWTGIGNNSNQFTGTYDGSGFTISNLTILSSLSNQGMFGYISSGGTVQNVGLVGGSITGEWSAGGIAGRLNGGTISGCYNTGDVFGGGYVGGVVGGVFNNGTVQNCYATGSVTGAGSEIGGVVGYSIGGTVQNCYATGSVTGDFNIGGVVGWNSFGGTVKNSYATGDVTSHAIFGGVGSGDRIGGVVGYGTGGMVQNCYATGSVTGLSRIGGIVGHNENNAVQNCVALNTGVTSDADTDLIGRVVGQNNGGGTLTNNYAWSEMTVTTNGGIWTPAKTTTGKDGADITTANAKTKAAWETAGFTFVTNGDGWYWTDGKMPHLRSTGALDWPGYLVFQDGTAANPFLIFSEADLLKISKNNTGTPGDGNWTLEKHYKQIKNITLTAPAPGGSNWTPVGDNSTYDDNSSFTGTYDGGGFTITGLTINASTANNQGMFGVIGTNGKVQNVGLVGGSVIGDMQVGGVAGINNGTISNCYTSGSITGFMLVGGVLGVNDSGTVRNCVALNPSVSGSSDTGRVVGDSISGTLTNNYAWSGMGGSTGLFTNKTLTGKDGADITADNITTVQAMLDAVFGVNAPDLVLMLGITPGGVTLALLVAVHR